VTLASAHAWGAPAPGHVKEPVAAGTHDELVQHMPGTRGDALRAIEIMPGVGRTSLGQGNPIRIDPDGVVRRVSLVEESATGFGNACSRTLSGSRWAAPKDKAGRSVATEIRYTCRFVVQP
jgi:hypothetical protein